MAKPVQPHGLTRSPAWASSGPGTSLTTQASDPHGQRPESLKTLLHSNSKPQSREANGLNQLSTQLQTPPTLLLPWEVRSFKQRWLERGWHGLAPLLPTLVLAAARMAKGGRQCFAFIPETFSGDAINYPLAAPNSSGRCAGQLSSIPLGTNQGSTGPGTKPLSLGQASIPAFPRRASFNYRMSKGRAAWTTHDKLAPALKQIPPKRPREGAQALGRGYKTERLTGQAHGGDCLCPGLTRHLCSESRARSWAASREAEIRKIPPSPLPQSRGGCLHNHSSNQPTSGNTNDTPESLPKKPKTPLPSVLSDAHGQFSSLPQESARGVGWSVAAIRGCHLMLR